MERNVQKSVQYYHAACEKDHREGCNNAAVLLERETEDQESLALAGRLYARACQLDNALGCDNYGMFMLETWPKRRSSAAKPDEVKAGMEAFEKGCRLGEGQACVNLWTVYSQGNGSLKPDPARGAEYLRMACAMNYVAGCLNLGRFYAEDPAGEGRLNEAFDLFGKACELGGGEGCGYAGLFYEEGRGVEKKPDAALFMFRKGCNLESGWSCRLSANALMAAGEASAASGFYKRACDHDDAMGCRLWGLANLNQEDAGDKRNPLALDMLEKACGLGDGAGCGILSDLLFDGSLAAKDEARGVALLERSCELDDPAGCHSLAVRRYNGQIVKKDLALAGRLFLKSCDLGHASGCRNLAVMREEGAGVERDHDDALKRMSQACYLGYAQACDEAGTMYLGGGENKENVETAGKYFTVACQAGYAGGCHSLGSWHLKFGAEAGDDKVRRQALLDASAAFEKACDLGHGAACGSAADLLADAGGAEKQRAYLEKACRLGQESRCRQLKSAGGGSEKAHKRRKAGK